MEKSVEYYWQLLKDLSNEQKIDLICRLARSLGKRDKADENLASKYYGIWKDEDFATAEELIEEIQDSRKFKNDIEAL